jgi:hypothetical protein
MQSFSSRRFYSFRADANALGGFLEEPFRKNIPTLAPVSLPATGGLSTARSEAFNLDDIISCSSAYSRVSGQEHADGSICTLVTTTIEDLNILEVVTAERIVAQISIEVSKERGPVKFCVTGSRFDGLKFSGRDSKPTMNTRLNQPDRDAQGHGLTLSAQQVKQVGQDQAAKVISGFQNRQDASEWAKARHGWMSEPQRSGSGTVLCSLVDGFEGTRPGESSGHIVEIPGFGRFIFGELVASRNEVRLVAVYAELGCPVKGKVAGGSGGGGGAGNTD